MARRRLQQKGDLFDQGGLWKLRWHEDKMGPAGGMKRGWSRSVHIGPSVGLGKLTEKEARRLGWENFLSKLDAGVCAVPYSALTMASFVQQRFPPGPCGAPQEEWESALRIDAQACVGRSG